MCKKYDLDDVFAYTTARTVRIRDRRLGITMLLLDLAIFAYIVLFSILIRQTYKASGSVTGTVRMQLLEPESAYRWPDQSAPYCLGVTQSNSSSYTVYANTSSYMYNRGGVLAPQANCIYLDAADLVLNPLQGSSLFVPTRMTISNQTLLPQPDCATPAHSYCVWNTTSTELAYQADVEMYTLQVDHSFSSTIGLARSSVQMQGAMYNDQDQLVDPCAAYHGYPAGCPSNIAIGQVGKLDIFPIRTLLSACSVHSLDQIASVDDSAPLDTLTHRYAGMVIVLSISYSNYLTYTGSMNDNTVMYYYTVSVIPDEQFKAQFSMHDEENLLSPVRTVYDQHGIRLVVVQQGLVGVFNFQTLLVNLTAALSLLSVARVLTDLLMTKCCSLRNVYRQYKERMTVDFSDLRDSVEGRKLINRFKNEEHLIDPVPAAIQAAFAADLQRSAFFKRTMELPSQRSFDFNENLHGVPVIDGSAPRKRTPYDTPAGPTVEATAAVTPSNQQSANTEAEVIVRPANAVPNATVVRNPLEERTPSSTGPRRTSKIVSQNPASQHVLSQRAVGAHPLMAGAAPAPADVVVTRPSLLPRPLPGGAPVYTVRTGNPNVA